MTDDIYQNKHRTGRIVGGNVFRFYKAMNRQKKNSTEDLPVEILALIFQHAVAASSSPRYQTTFNLAHVCSLWRAVAWSTPSIWTMLRSGTVTNRNAANFLQILHLHFSNVQNLPLFLEISYSDVLASPEVPKFINRTLLHPAYADKIQSLVLNGTIMGRVLPEFTFVNLEELDVDMGWRNKINLTTLPNLKRLTIRRLNRLNPDSSQIPFTNLTSLRLINVYPHICVNFLVQCSQLREFVNHFDGIPVWPSRDTEFKISLGSTVVLKDLQRLCWTYIPQSGFDVLLPCLQLPALKTLGWHQSRRFPPTEELDLFTKNFCSNISNNLVKFIFERHSLSWPLAIIKDALLRFPRVEEITLKECSASNISLLLYTLAPTPNLEDSNDDHFYLPSLQTLTFSSGFRLGDEFKRRPVKSIEEANLQLPIQNFLSSNRFKRPGYSRFRLNLIDVNLYVPECCLLEGLIGRGFSLEVSRNGERVDRPGLWGKPLVS
ncbi:hypothetical protein Agabi119p4_11495 [Agaricus bisporus var. burnettii]|uniref:F-box domain-containing protein n=1 Tax=Agaricus bisporus var. burnettii TaxID=192524 RepID=A0A8H7C0E1_AGABI|nr:hypothetical protein Agabi119p4_11495 [Agaricus bisporus var. burnettii]